MRRIELEGKGWCKRRVAEGRMVIVVRVRKSKRLLGEVEPGEEV